VLALLMLATPLLRPDTGLAGRTGFNQQFNGGQNGQGFVFKDQGNGPQSQINPNSSGRQFQGRQSSGILRLGFLSGVGGTIVYTVALLVSLAAAAGMFMTKRWGKVLGISMAVIYVVVALLSIVPTLLIGFAFRSFNPLSMGLNVAHLVLAIAVIVLASIPAKQLAAPITSAVPPATPA